MLVQNYIPKKLHGIADLISEQRVSEAGGWTFLPDGVVTLMFRMGTCRGMKFVKTERLTDENNHTGRFCFLVGLNTSPHTVSFEEFHYLAVYLRPVALRTLFGIPGCELRNFMIDGELLISGLDMVESTLNELPDFTARAQWLKNWLYHKVNETPELHAAISIYTITDKLAGNDFAFRVSTIDTMLEYSRAQSNRIFNEWFGLSAGTWQRMMRFIKTMNQLHISNESLTKLGLGMGYYDQAHFVRSFKEFADMTPGEYRKRMSKLPGQLPM